MKNKILVVALSLGISTHVAANADAAQIPFLKNKLINAIAFPLFAATAYYFFDEAGESYDYIRDYARRVWNKNKKEESCDKTKAPSWLAQAAQEASKRILRKRTRRELLLKELDKQSYYLTGAIGTSILSWFLRTYVPEIRSVLYVGEKP